jgi:HD-GYP domain-containing protein (c-di-GMP phosphodiesterase class II)
MGHREALEEILHHRFDQFDPVLAEVFAEVCGFVYPEGSCFTELPDTPNMPHGDLMHSIGAGGSLNID